MRHRRCDQQTIGMFVRHPVPGRVKTRLAAELGDQRACAIYAAFLSDLVARFGHAGTQRFLCFTPDDGTARLYFEELARDKFELWPQPDGDLGARLQCFFGEHLRTPADRVIVIGSDSPTLPQEYLDRAFDELTRADCVLGPATDGGYYLIGMTDRVWPVFENVSWSEARVLDQTVARVVACGARLALLPVWYDVDTPDDLQVLAGHMRALAACGSTINVEAIRLRLTNVDSGRGSSDWIP